MVYVTPVEGIGEGDALGLALGLLEGLLLGLTLGLAEGDAEGLGLGETLGLTLGLKLADSAILFSPYSPLVFGSTRSSVRLRSIKLLIVLAYPFGATISITGYPIRAW